MHLPEVTDSQFVGISNLTFGSILLFLTPYATLRHVVFDWIACWKEDLAWERSSVENIFRLKALPVFRVPFSAQH